MAHERNRLFDEVELDAAVNERGEVELCFRDGWDITVDGSFSPAEARELGRVVMEVADLADNVRGATHGARHFWAGLALAGAAAEATQQAVDYLARSGAEDAPVARGVLWHAAEQLAAGAHTRGWRAR